MTKTDLSLYQNVEYSPGKNKIIQVLWYITSALVFQSALFPLSSVKVWLLRLFGAKVGSSVVIKPKVTIKFPWRLEIGDFVWIGEGAWIDNLATTTIGNHVCISQGALLLCGNHDFSARAFNLRTSSIILEDGCWIGAKSLVGPGVTCGSHSVLSLQSATSKNLEPYGIYRGNPAELIKKRVIKN